MRGFSAFIGFGEAGQAFAARAGWRAFDIKSRGANRVAKLADYARAGVLGCDGSAEALAGAQSILSVVTADQALLAAEDTAQSIAPDALFFDMNSVAPGTKRAAAAAIEAAGAR